jgi:ribosome-binding factor A
MGNEVEQRMAIEGFLHATGFIRNQLGKRLKLRHVPQLSFRLDATIAYGVRISSILNDLATTGTTNESEGASSDA